MTPFTDIYDLNSSIKLDTRINGKPTNLIYQLYYNYLKMAISIFQYDCYQNITDVIGFSQNEFSFVGDGIKNNFVLDIVPPINSLFYVSVNNIEIPKRSYTYDNINNKIIFNIIPTINGDIYIASYIIGQFNSAILNFRELQIMTEAINIPWLEQNLNRDQLLQQMVYSSDFKIYSQSSHIQQLKNVIDTQKRYVNQLINEYTYKACPNGVLGLGGGILNPTNTMGSDGL